MTDRKGIVMCKRYDVMYTKYNFCLLKCGLSNVSCKKTN